MLAKTIAAVGLAAVSACPLLADFSYQQTAKVTGGAMAGMLKVAGVFSKQAREPIQTTISIKGDRMVDRGATHATIIDLNAGTITSVDLQKKTYTVMTFEQMKQMMEQAREKMKQKGAQNGDSADMQFKVSINPTGAAKPVHGLDAKETVVKIEMQATDTQTGQSGTMVVTSDMWLAPEIPGYREVREFQKRMAEKIAWTGMSSMFAAQPGIGQGMAEAQKEASKMDGLPIYTTMSMGGAGTPPANGDPDAAAAQQQQQQSSKPSLGGMLGAGIGIRRKNNDSSQAQQNSNGSGSGNMIEMTTELSGFSGAAVDEALFAVPAGFKRVEPKGMQ